MIESRLHLLLVLMILLMSVATMGSVHEWAEDEPYYMIAAMHMDDGGSLIVPTYADGSPRFPKPILFYWLVLLSYKLLGAGLFASRLPALLSAAAALYFTWRLARGPDGRLAEAAGSVYILSSMYLFYFHGKVSITDMTMTAALTAGFCYFSEFLQGISGKRGLYQAAFAFGLAGLTKGPVALVIALLTAGAAMVFWRKDDINRPSFGQVFAVLVIVLAVSGWWYVYMALRFWPDFFRHQVGSEMVSRMDGFFLVRGGNLLWYLRRLIESGYPWTLLAGCALLLRALPGNRRFSRHLAWCGFASVLLFYGLLIDTKRTRYLVPALPMIAVILSDYLTYAFHAVRPGFVMRRLLRLFMVLAFSIFLCLLAFFAVSARQDLGSEMYLKMGVYLISVVVITAFLWSRAAWVNHKLLMAGAAFGMVLTFTFATLVFQETLKKSPMEELALKTYSLPAGSRTGFSGIRRDLFSGILYFFGNRKVLVPGRDPEGQTHRVVDQQELDDLGEEADVVYESFSFSRGISVDLKASFMEGDLLDRIPRDKFYLVRLTDR